jgi:hypothetical protein
MFDHYEPDKQLLEDLKDIEELESKGFVSELQAQVLVSEAFERFHLRQ